MGEGGFRASGFGRAQRSAAPCSKKGVAGSSRILEFFNIPTGAKRHLSRVPYLDFPVCFIVTPTTSALGSLCGFQVWALRRFEADG